jgi:hypothetical protein
VEIGPGFFNIAQRRGFEQISVAVFACHFFAISLCLSSTGPIGDKYY